MKKIITGIQPSGTITLGNYIGAIKQMTKLQNEYNSFIFIADLHAITVQQDSKELKKNIKDLIALYLACGLDKDKNTIFLQSENEFHPAVSWILECNTMHGELSRMTQFKDKSSKNESFSAALFTYPVLMAADILIYDVDFVPVGIDQKQHVELARDIAIRFNKKYEGAFKVPDVKLSKSGTKIMDLINPDKKMSKSSDNPKSYISMLDDETSIRKKIMSATTDSECLVKYDVENKPGISNLMNIVVSLKDITHEEIEEMFIGKNYGEFKTYVADTVVEELTKIQTKYNEIINSNIINEVLDNGKNITKKVAKEKYDKLKTLVGMSR